MSHTSSTVARSPRRRIALGHTLQAGLALLAVLAVFATLAVTRASAQDDARTFSLGAGLHVLSTVEQVCDQDGDVVSCSTFRPFAGGDLSGHFWLLDWFALGARAALSKDLDASETESSTGESEERDQLLWRFSAEGRFTPLLLPSGMWLAGELGLAIVTDSLDEIDAEGRVLRSANTSQTAPLVGAALGWDFHLNHSVLLGFDVRAQWMLFSDDPPELQPSVSSVTFGSAVWLGMAGRLTVEL